MTLFFKLLILIILAYTVSVRYSWMIDMFRISAINILILTIMLSYRVTQSWSNSFWGDVVLDNFENAFKDEGNILDQTYIKQINSDVYRDYFNFPYIIRNTYKNWSSPRTPFCEFLVVEFYISLIKIFFNHSKNFELQLYKFEHTCFWCIWLKYSLHPYMPC